MSKLFTSALLTTIILFNLQAQDVDKKGCNPSSCSPGNTKIAESSAITELRDQVMILKNKIELSEAKVQPIKVGRTEEKSIELIITELNNASLSLGFDFNTKELKGAQLIKYLNKRTSILLEAIK